MNETYDKKPYMTLATYSNLPVLVSKHNVLLEEMKFEKKEDIIIPVEGKCLLKSHNTNIETNRDIICNTIKSCLEEHALKNTKFTQRFTENRSEIFDSVANSIIERLWRQHDSQGWFSFRKHATFSAKFHYSERFGFTDVQNFKAEFVIVTATGVLVSNQEFTKIDLNIELQIHGPTLFIETHNDEKTKLIIHNFLSDLVWHNVKGAQLQQSNSENSRKRAREPTTKSKIVEKISKNSENSDKSTQLMERTMVPEIATVVTEASCEELNEDFISQKLPIDAGNELQLIIEGVGEWLLEI